MSNSEKSPDTITVAILIACLSRALSDSPTTRGELNELARALSALPGSEMIIEQVGRLPIDLVLARLRHAGTYRPLLRELATTALRPLNARASFAPNEMEQWPAVMTQFSLHGQAGPLEWLPIFHALQREGFMSPADIAGLNRESILAISPPQEIVQILHLRQAARAPRGDTLSRPPQLRAMAASTELIHAIRAPSVEATEFARHSSGLKRTMGLDDSFDSMGPAAKTRALAESNASSGELVPFLDSGAQMNILQQVRSSFPELASGVKGYVEFWRLINVAPFPPHAIYFIRRIALFPQGRTFGMYVNHVETSFSVLGLNVTWRTPAVNAVIAGLANAPNYRVEFPNILSFAD